jgi:hypothetical protein
MRHPQPERAPDMAHVIHVRAAWDDEAGVWYTAESSVPGLAIEAETLERLRERLLVIIPDLLEDEMEAWLHIVSQIRDVIPF